MLMGYFDETGTDSASQVTALSGYVGRSEDWTNVESEWIGMLSEVSVDGTARPLHMTDAMAQTGDFSHMDKPKINYLITQCAKILGRHNLIPMMSAVIQSDWDNVVSGPFLERFPKPLDLCFDDLVRTMSDWSNRKANSERIVPMFAHISDDYSARFRLVYESFGVDVEYQNSLGPLSFDLPKRVVPLQCADMLAWLHRVHVRNTLSSSLMGQQYALHLAAPTRPQGHWFDRPALLLTMKRWVETGKIY